MLVIDGENGVGFDVDQTLFMHDKMGEYQVLNPYSDSLIPGNKHDVHVELLKQYKGRGLTVIVWSSGGVEWAEEVVKAFGLEEFVDVVMTKPNKLVDDLEPHDIFPCRIYLPYERS